MIFSSGAARRAVVLDARILIADATATEQARIRDGLASSGYRHVRSASDAAQVVAASESGWPDAILLDTRLPGTDALDLCRQLATDGQAESNDRSLDSPSVLVQEDATGQVGRLRCFAAGAVDYLVKPVSVDELAARMRIHLETRKAVQTLRRFQARFKQELEVATAMQESLQPSQTALAAVRDRLGIDVAAHCEMSSELGGDMWGLRLIDETRLGLYVADFSGHGLGSAVNAFRLHAMLDETGLRHERPELVMQALNVRLASSLPRGTYATMFYGVIDIDRDRLDYAGAGAPPPWVIYPDGEMVATNTRGVPLGIKRWQRYEEKSLAFPPGASLVLHSDALVETPDAAGMSWDEATLHDALGALSTMPSAAGAVGQMLHRFDPGRERPLPDDLTLVILRRTERERGIV